VAAEAKKEAADVRKAAGANNQSEEKPNEIKI
jgi:hypothetical protein